MALLTVTEAFADFRSGHPEVYNPGRLVDEKDPVVKGRESYFVTADAAAARVRVEAATAAPGERRARSKPAKKAAARKAPAKKAAAKKPAPKPADTPLPTGDTPADPPSSEVL